MQQITGGSGGGGLLAEKLVDMRKVDEENLNVDWKEGEDIYARAV